MSNYKSLISLKMKVFKNNGLKLNTKLHSSNLLAPTSKTFQATKVRRSKPPKTKPRRRDCHRRVIKRRKR